MKGTFPAMPDDGIRCLVVEDQERVRSALVRALGAAGYMCREAGSGREAVEVLEAEGGDAGFEVMLSDIRMPEMDGVALLAETRKRWPDLAVIMVTGVADVDTAVDCLRVGAFDYLTKPFQIAEVQARMAQALEKRRLVLENRRYQHHLAELVEQQAVRIEELFLEGIQTLVDALEAKDRYTQGHSVRVAAYSGATARVMGLDEDRIQLVELGAELHDVGKIGVNEAVLNKHGRLTKEEYHHVMQHTVIGAHILEPLLKNAPAALAIVRSHHERLDGAGLPDGLTAEALDLEVRVVSVADAFDAMTSARPYRPGLPPAEAIRELRRHQDTQFDADVVDAFVNAHYDLDALPIATPRVRRRHLPRGVAGARALTHPRP